jgi:hypothetical protein
MGLEKLGVKGLTGLNWLRLSPIEGSIWEQ